MRVPDLRGLRRAPVPGGRLLSDLGIEAFGVGVALGGFETVSASGLDFKCA